MRTDLVVQFFSGVLVTANVIAGLFFLRFWRESRDRLFAFFAFAFFLLAVQRSINAVVAEPSPVIYLLRLLAFVLILWAIADKNFARRA